MAKAGHFQAAWSKPVKRQPRLLGAKSGRSARIGWATLAESSCAASETASTSAPRRRSPGFLFSAVPLHFRLEFGRSSGEEGFKACDDAGPVLAVDLNLGDH
jgi:hypothetical protein